MPRVNLAATAIDEANPEPTRKHRPARSMILTVLSALLLTVVMIKVIASCSAHPSPFPYGWVAVSWVMPKGSTPSQVNDGEQAVLEEIAHLGDPAVEATVEGDVIHIGSPLEYQNAITVIEGRTFTPRISLRMELQGEPTTNSPANANLGIGQACVTDNQPGVACSADRSLIGQFGAEIVDGASIEGADVIAPGATGAPQATGAPRASDAPQAAGDWSVAIRFTAAGAKQIAYVINQRPKGTRWTMVVLTTIESTDTFALTPMLGGAGIVVDSSGVGHLTGLTQPQALHIAGTLRLARHPVVMKGRLD